MTGPRVRRCYVDGPFGQIHCRTATPENTACAPILCLHMSPKSGESYHDVLPHLAADRIARNDDCVEQSQRADAIMQNGRRIDAPHQGYGLLNAYPQDAAALILDFIDGVEGNG